MNRLWSQGRDILVWQLSPRKMLYCIPIYTQQETARLGSQLQIVIDLDAKSSVPYRLTLNHHTSTLQQEGTEENGDKKNPSLR